MDAALYQSLIDSGFRRSGGYLYRPNCPHCNACVSVRVPVDAFRPNRSQRRCLRSNGDIELRIRSSEALVEHHDLYVRYLQTRHPGAGMSESASSLDDYLEFLDSPWSTTLCYEFHRDGRVIAVAVTDQLPQGLSAVYTFFEPSMPTAGLGTYAILRQIDQARHEGRPWLYLGYWIAGSQKMNYKERFRPIQGWSGTEWATFGKGEAIEFATGVPVLTDPPSQY